MATNTSGKGKIFGNPLLELLTYTSLPVTLFTYLSIIIAFFLLNFYWGAAGPVTAAVVFAGAFFSWTFFEYMAHRYIFHWASEARPVKRMTWVLHGIHHEYPRAEERVFMPPLPGILITSFLFLICWLLCGRFAFVFMAGFISGYLAYACIHFAIHKKSVPRYLRRLWVHHNLHHYRYQDKAFGVSNLFWDRVFGTMPPRER